jgi:hypothetical protein
MAATRKSAKRSAGKKKPQSRQKHSKKTAKALRSEARAAKKPVRSKPTALQRRARQLARDGFDSVLEAGGKTWRTLKKTTTQMVEDVRDTFAGESKTPRGRSRRR